VTLIRHVSDFTLAYFGSEDGFSEGAWQDEWLEKHVQPSLVKINIELENEMFWPEIIIGLKVAASSTGIDENALAQQEEQ
jgi:general secretion pathway protein J